MKKYKIFAVCAVVITVLAGCAHFPGGISDSTTPINGRQYIELSNVVGKDGRVLLLGLIPISGSNKIQDAINDAKQKGNADALIEVTADEYYHYWILWSSWTTKVSGTGIRFQ